MSIKRIEIVAYQSNTNNARFQAFMRAGISQKYPNAELIFKDSIIGNQDVCISDVREHRCEALSLINFLKKIFYSINKNEWKDYYHASDLNILTNQTPEKSNIKMCDLDKLEKIS